MLFDFDVADFRQLKFAVQLESALRVREAIVSITTFESRKPSLLAALDAQEEGLECFIQSSKRVL